MNNKIKLECGCEFDLNEDGKPIFHADFNRINLECHKAWELFGSGKTKGCFQLESKLGRLMAKKLKPDNIEQLSGLMSILRPGCLEAELEDGKSVTEHYINRKNLDEEVSYIHPATESILKPTYGLLIYQESAMKLAQQLAGFDLKQADALRKAIGKKKADLMAKVKQEFLEGIETQKIVDKETGDQIFGWIEKSQRYSFNKSHAMSYAMLSYMSAIAKSHFMLEFYTSYLYYSKEKPKPFEEIYELINDAKSFNIFVRPPSILKLNTHFDLIDESIYFGLSDIKHVGESVVEKLRNLIHPDITWFEFLLKAIPPDKTGKIDSRAMESLINSGACDCFNIPRIKMAFEFKLWTEMTDRERLWIKNNIILNEKATLLGILEAMLMSPSGRAGACSNKKRVEVVQGLIESIHNPPYELLDKPHQVAQLESSLLGICLTATFLDESQNRYKANCTCQEFNDGFNNRYGYISIACQIDEIRVIVTKRGMNPGQEMAFLIIADESGVCDSVVAFPAQWQEFQPMLQEGNRILITGKTNKKMYKDNKRVDSADLGQSLIIESVMQI